jgi:hypothetical protein
MTTIVSHRPQQLEANDDDEYKFHVEDHLLAWGVFLNFGGGSKNGQLGVPTTKYLLQLFLSVNCLRDNTLMTVTFHSLLVDSGDITTMMTTSLL